MDIKVRVNLQLTTAIVVGGILLNKVVKYEIRRKEVERKERVEKEV